MEAKIKIRFNHPNMDITKVYTAKGENKLETLANFIISERPRSEFFSSQVTGKVEAMCGYILALDADVFTFKVLNDIFELIKKDESDKQYRKMVAYGEYNFGISVEFK